MKRLLFIVFCLISLVSKAQVYQSMPQYGYGPVKRFDIDSSLTIPTTCGVPTLRTTLTKKAAIAFDSCNNKFYKYNPKTAIWSEISGGSGSQNLQEVTDIGSTTTNEINAFRFAAQDPGAYYSLYLWNAISYLSGTGSIIYPSSAQNIYFPDNSGTLALTSDIQTIDTTSLSNRINLRVPYTGATADVDLDTHKLSAQSLQVEGTNGNGHIDLKHQSANATATGQTTALFANSNGDLKWKNDGNHYTTLTTQQTADRAYTFQNKSYTLADSSDVANKVNISDTSTMLSKYLRKTDTSSLSSRIDTKLNASDTSSLSTRINNKGYAITIGHTQSNYVASTTYYYGMTASGFTTTAAIRRIYIPVSGTIKAAYLYARTTGSTTTQSWTMSIRLNNNSNTSISSVADNSLDKVWSNTGLSIAVVAGDYIEITTTTPAWTTAAGNTTIYGTIFIQ